MRAREVVTARARAAAAAMAAAASAAALAAFVACGSGGGGGGGPSCANSDQCPLNPPSWSGQVQSIVNTYCATPQCHAPGGIEGAQIDLSTYPGVHANFTRMITQVATCPALMPPYDASPPAVRPPADAQEALLCWLEAQAPDN